MSSRSGTRRARSTPKTSGWSKKVLLVAVVVPVAVAAVLLLSMTSRTGPPAERKALGPAGAPVRIVVYFDFQCPHCDSLHSGAEAQIVEKYVKANRVHLEVRPFAVMGPDSVRASEAALCAADQGRFWEYRDALFSAYRQNGRAALAEDGLLGVAGSVGLDTKALGACLSQHQRRAEVDDILRQGKSDGVQVVPTVFINGQKLEGALPFESFATIIEGSLAK